MLKCSNTNVPMQNYECSYNQVQMLEYTHMKMFIYRDTNGQIHE